MPFFIRNNQSKFKNRKNEKRKRPVHHEKVTKKVNPKNVNGGMDEIISSDDDLSDHNDAIEESSSEEETQQEKKLRLTKKYLEEIEKEEGKKSDLAEHSRSAVSQRLKEEALEEEGRLQKIIAHEYENVTPEVCFILKGHNRPVTCLVISSDEKFIYSGSKDCSIIKWSAETGKKIKVVPRSSAPKSESESVGHKTHILSMALSSDDKFLVSGGHDNTINVWNPSTMTLLKNFKGHKGAITGLSFQKGTHQLISASMDRSLKLWSLDDMGYIETMFGHQDSITGIDGFQGETAITSGGRDNTVRIWKIAEESQLVFQGHDASIDCVCVSSPRHFVSGDDKGGLLLWGLNKKKPLFKLMNAHGTDSESEEPYWITCVSALKNSDLVASGSQDGEIKLWKRDDEHWALRQISSIPVKGFVNALQFSSSGKLLVVGLGQEHRLGRWWKIKEAKNNIVIYRWNKS